MQLILLVDNIFRTLNRQMVIVPSSMFYLQRLRLAGADPGFQVRGDALQKKLRRSERGAKIVGVFPVKIHDFTPKDHIFSNCEGRREHFWGISCEKSRFYGKKNLIFAIFRGCVRRVRPTWVALGLSEIYIENFVSMIRSITRFYYNKNSV